MNEQLKIVSARVSFAGNTHEVTPQPDGSLRFDPPMDLRQAYAVPYELPRGEYIKNQQVHPELQS